MIRRFLGLRREASHRALYALLRLQTQATQSNSNSQEYAMSIPPLRLPLVSVCHATSTPPTVQIYSIYRGHGPIQGPLSAIRIPRSTTQSYASIITAPLPPLASPSSVLHFPRVVFTHTPSPPPPHELAEKRTHRHGRPTGEHNAGDGAPRDIPRTHYGSLSMRFRGSVIGISPSAPSSPVWNTV